MHTNANKYCPCNYKGYEVWEMLIAAKWFYIFILLLRNVVIAFDLQDSFVMSNLLFIFMVMFLNICP